MAPAMARAGMAAKVTRVIFQPLKKAMTKPAMNMAKVWIISETFSPIAPWNEKQSAANFDEIYDWFT